MNTTMSQWKNPAKELPESGERVSILLYEAAKDDLSISPTVQVVQATFYGTEKRHVWDAICFDESDDGGLRIESDCCENFESFYDRNNKEYSVDAYVIGWFSNPDLPSDLTVPSFLNEKYGPMMTTFTIGDLIDSVMETVKRGAKTCSNCQNCRLSRFGRGCSKIVEKFVHNTIDALYGNSYNDEIDPKELMKELGLDD